MALACDDGHVIEGTAVHILLPWQAREGVPLALDPVTVNAAIDDNDVHSCLTLAKGELVKNERIRIVLVEPTHFHAKLTSDVYLTHRRDLDCIRAEL